MRWTYHKTPLSSALTPNYSTSSYCLSLHSRLLISLVYFAIEVVKKQVQVHVSKSHGSTCNNSSTCIVSLQVLAFFFLCLWLVPFSFFISLSANDLVLPTSIGSEGGIEHEHIIIIKLSNAQCTPGSMYGARMISFVDRQ